MFWLWNELFGFPVNDCDFESIECNKSYIPILNWDNDNEFVWRLWDPLDWWVDASNVTFNSKNIQKRPSSVKKVDQALETLMNMIEDSKSAIKSFTFTLNEDWETLEWNIVYEDDSWTEYTKTASINLKDIVEWWQVLTLKDIIADSIEADEWIFESVQSWWLDVTWNAVIQWNETVNWTVVMNSTLDVAWKATINWWADITWDLNVLEDSETHEGWEIHSKSLETTEDATIGWDLSVAWNETVTGTSTINWATTINNTLAVTGWTTLQDLTVWGNEIVTGTSTINWETTINNKLTVSDDIIANDDLTVSWNTSLNTLETSSSASVGWQLVVWWAATIQDALTVEWQINTETLRSDEIVTDELRVNTSLDLWPNGIAPDFVLQSEKNQPNGVAWLDENWLINASNMPDPNISFHYETSTQGSTIYTLQHVPLSDSSIMVFTDSGTALFPTIDYTCVNGVITFTQMWATESSIIWVVSKWPETNPSQNPDRSFSITKNANGFTATWNYPSTTTTSLIASGSGSAKLYPDSTEPTCSRMFDLSALSQTQQTAIEETLEIIISWLDTWESTNWRWTEEAYAALVYAYNHATNECGQLN